MLKPATADIERERREGVKLALAQRPRYELVHGLFCERRVGAEKVKTRVTGERAPLLNVRLRDRANVDQVTEPDRRVPGSVVIRVADESLPPADKR